MDNKISVSDKAFLERQRLRLLKLQADLSRSAQAEEGEERGIQSQALGAAHEFEDDAQRLDSLEVEGILVRQSLQRLPMVARALTKISDGTYGLSDASGKAIPRDRLEAVPEAIYTADEEAAREAGR